jgi:DNA-binding NtrC family response regulator
MSEPRILIVEDEAAIRLALSGLLKREGYTVEQAPDGGTALGLLADNAYDFILTDLALGEGASGMDVLRKAKELHPETPVVMITAHGNEKVAVDAMKLGADDYVPKPFDNDEIRLVVRRAVERTQLARENQMLRERVEREFGMSNLIGSGASMRSIFGTIHKVAETDLTVLVRGESGTGKELVAQALHEHSARKNRPFVAVNCAAISAELVESELFGHEKGAFTGADAKRAGRFETADGGTIFLDEIGDMAPATQAKVLRVLQERSFERVGGTQPIEVDVRVVAATHRDLEAEVEAGRFREDLYYRLKVVEIQMPALRDRPEDLPALSDRFLEQVAERLDRPIRKLAPSALAALTRHTWPGNVRELRNVIEQAAVLAAGDEIECDDIQVVRRPGDGLPAAVPVADVAFSDAKKHAVEAFERSYLLRALRENDGNISRTAEAIGMVRQSLQQKIRELGLRDEDWTQSI